MRIGSLFTGYGGLDMAVQSVLGGEVAWYSEIDRHACTVLAAHYSGVPNLGDVTRIDWATVEPVDVLTGGYPCQPFSHAGQRKGTDDERHLWPFIADAIRSGVLRRGGVAVFENVDGHRSLGLADVLGDLACMGMSARWGVVRAADAGAPHGRKRVFIVASPAHTNGDGFGWVNAARGEGQQRRRLRPRAAGHSISVANANDIGRTRSIRIYDRRARPADGSGVDWGRYTSAIVRWERVLGRPAPAPTDLGAQGKPRLSPEFVEWLMGLDEGHVTGHGLPRTAQLKMLGNGVVPQQAALALRLLGVGA